MSVVRSVPRSPDPIEQLKLAVLNARESGLRVRAGDIGVYAVSQHAAIRWELDPLCRDGAVDAIGALLLMCQPPAINPFEATAQALGVDGCWVAGIVAGMDLAPRESRWVQSPQRLLYAKAYELGTLMRMHVQSFDRPALESEVRA